MTTGDYFIFDGTDVRSFDALVFERQTYNSPQKEYTAVSIPGRSGDLLLDGRRFSNVTHEYDVIIYRRFDENYEALRSFLLSRNGYCRLEDSIHPNEFYSAYYSEPIVPTVTRDRSMGKFTLKFIRKPQRWLISGEQEIVLRRNGSTVKSSITNPTYNHCYPIFKCSGSSMANGFKFKFNTTTITLTDMHESSTALNSGTLTIDLDTLQAYKSTTFYNKYVKYTIGDVASAFMLKSGSNSFTYTTVSNSRLTDLTIVPRWYLL